jgi:S1-C subfamily serine protease
MRLIGVILGVILAASAYAADVPATVAKNTVAADLVDQKLQKVLYPVVRVLNGQGGGSGTVVYSEDREGNGEFQNFVMTNHHVVDNLIKVERVWDNLTRSYKFVERNDLAEVELFTYANGGATVTKTAVKADVIAYVADEDIALLKLRHTFKIEFVAKVLPPGKSLRLFQEIYAVGCPLLVDPMFTKGEVTDIDNLIDNVTYTGGTANIIWGNSGGAVMSQFEDDGEWYFCGIPSRGYGAPNGQMVTYLGYYITPKRIMGFIVGQKLDFLVDPAKTPTQCLEERAKIQGEKREAVEEKENSPPADTDGPMDLRV